MNGAVFTPPCVFVACKTGNFTAVAETNYTTCIFHKSYGVRVVKAE
jgi:hypothetical protein